MDLINIIKICLIAIIQGITEPLPISSSAHMILLSEVLNYQSSLNFEIIINFASTLAIAIFFRRKIYFLFKNTFSNNQSNEYRYLNKSYLFKLLYASIPAVFVGFFFKDFIDKYFNNINFIGFSLILTSIIIFITFLMLKEKVIFTDEITYLDAIPIGLMQALALLPGISRSGSTIFGGITRNIKLNQIFDFSFFLYLIASTGAFILSLFDMDYKNLDLMNLIIPFIITFITTYFSIKVFSQVLNKKTMLFFSLYTFILGIFLIIMFI